MPLPFTLLCVWALVGCLVGMGPQRWHWPAAWALIATGIPLLGLVTLQMGPWWGMAALVAGASLLRWPLLRAGEALRRRIGF